MLFPENKDKPLSKKLEQLKTLLGTVSVRTSLLANPVDFSKLNDHTTVEGSWNPSDMGNVRDVVRKKILSANTMSYPDEEWVEDFLSFYDIEEEKTKPKTKKKISEKGNTPKKKAREKPKRKRYRVSQPKPKPWQKKSRRKKSTANLRRYNRTSAIHP